jgi:hypothetical protein
MRKISLSLIVITVVISLYLFLSQKKEIAINLSTSKAAASLLQTSDITCAGVFLTPGVQMGGKTSAYPVTMRYENGNRHYFMYDGTGHILEFPEPTLSPCNTVLSQVNRASLESWGGDWGTFDVNGGDNVIPGISFTTAMGLNYDSVSSRLLLSWVDTYVGYLPHNSFAAASLVDNSHSLSTSGCWGITNLNPKIAGSGILNIPSSFVSSYLPSGARWGIGFGGAVASYTGLSLGPTLIAIAPPSNNSCAPNTDNFVSSGTVLAKYGQNNVGPNCSTNGNSPTGPGSGLGCTPTEAPTAPYAAKLGLSTYSKDMYAPDWDPWQGHGWFGFSTAFNMGWYDDGIKNGIVVPILAPEGWTTPTILGNPAPTFDTPSKNIYYKTGTLYVSSTSTHDGNNINPGDMIWIQTCTPGVDTGCEVLNGRQLSFAIVDSVSSSTGRISFHLMDSDYGSGNHLPVIGGKIYHGCLYAHGSPTCSRGVYRLQIYDPAQYAEVVSGARQPYDVTYDQEIDMTSLVPGFGCPSCGSGVKIGTEHHGPVSTMPDPLAHQIMIAFDDGNSPPYLSSNAIYVYNVGPNAVTPPIASQPTPGPTPSPTPSPSPVGVPTSPSANCTKAVAVMDALGHVWTINSSWTLRDGVYSMPAEGPLPGAQGTTFKIINGAVYTFDPRFSSWYKWTESAKTVMGGYGYWTSVGATEPSCSTSSIVGDLNNDGIVNSLDWSYMNSKWFTADATADLNHDGIVNSIDFSILNNNWQKSSS